MDSRHDLWLVREMDPAGEEITRVILTAFEDPQPHPDAECLAVDVSKHDAQDIIRVLRKRGQLVFDSSLGRGGLEGPLSSD